ncbi:hypothetical protein G6F70_001687 [Rhizopus microsporus]|nr:hypothetical protein G6F71_001713 [Rhizopus microsporus]KAG1203069.1 hypothetical protein G6F70_001687 [Rhizopus microsporus]KAG1215369.1 hypothetical protein G6F69_001044 [Rhizopus microsporus]
MRTIRDDPFVTYDLPGLELHNVDVEICRKTVISSLKRMEYGSYIAAHKPALDKWAHKHVNWTVEQWSSVIWSDEPRFTVTGNHGGARIIRKVGERYGTKHIVQTKKYGGGGVMIWNCFHANGFGPLVLVDGIVDQDKYINILAHNFHPWFAQLYQQEERDIILQDDGVSCHTGGYTRWWKKTHQIRDFEYWPAQSPDLDPIEHVWAVLDKLIKERRSEIRNIEDLSIVLRKE